MLELLLQRTIALNGETRLTSQSFPKTSHELVNYRMVEIFVAQPMNRQTMETGILNLLGPTTATKAR